MSSIGPVSKVHRHRHQAWCDDDSPGADRSSDSGGCHHGDHHHGGCSSPDGSSGRGGSSGVNGDRSFSNGVNSGSSINGGFNGNSAFSAGPNEALKPWEGDISAGADITGLDPNMIGGQVWAESRGNPNDPSTNADGTTDLGLMQISNERWQSDICPKLTADERQKIIEKTGKRPEDLDMADPHENVIGGSCEIAQRIRENGGNVEAGLAYYVNGGDSDIGSPTYVDDVLNYQKILAEGGQLPDD